MTPVVLILLRIPVRDCRGSSIRKRRGISISDKAVAMKILVLARGGVLVESSDV